MAYLMERVISKILEESNFNIDEDVEFLLEELKIKELVESYKTNPEDSFYKYVKNADTPNDIHPVIGSVRSDVLPSSISQKANEKKDISINFLISNYGHGYIFNRRTIQYSIPFYVIKDLGEFGLDNDIILKENPTYEQYFNLNYWRGIIAHELTHWLEDAIYGKISKFVDKSIERERQLNIKKNKKWDDVEWRDKIQSQIDRLSLEREVTGDTETEAIIAQIAQHYKHTDPEIWDRMSFTDLYNTDKTFRHYINKAKYGTPARSRFDNPKAGLSGKEFDQYMRKIIKKMARVGILGKNMRYPERDLG